MNKPSSARWMGTMTLGLVFAVTATGCFSNKFEQELGTEESAVKLTREVLRGGYDLITTEELKELADSGKEVLLIDAMPYEGSYKKGHIPGAVQFTFPIPEMDAWDSSETDGKSVDDYTALLGDDKGKTIVVYCGFVKCTRSHNGAMWANKLGYQNVLRHPGGVYAWKGAGYSLETE